MKSKVYENGTKVWKLPNGLLHRENGPAVEYASGNEAWYINGIKFTEQEYKYKTRSKKLKLLL
jgi:hypothetical protein